MGSCPSDLVITFPGIQLLMINSITIDESLGIFIVQYNLHEALGTIHQLSF